MTTAAKAAPSGLRGNVVDYLFENALKPENVGRPFLVIDDGSAKVTFRQLYERTCQVGHYLRAIGLKPGDRMMVKVEGVGTLSNPCVAGA